MSFLTRLAGIASGFVVGGAILVAGPNMAKATCLQHQKQHHVGPVAIKRYVEKTSAATRHCDWVGPGGRAIYLCR